jgi:galactofuranose transport system substrate-binding protein
MIHYEELIERLRRRELTRAEFLRAAVALGVSIPTIATLLNGGSDVALAGCDPSKTPASVTKKSKYTVGFSQSELNNPWRTAETDSMNDEAKKQAGEFNYIWTNANSSTNKQVSDVEDFVAKKVDFIVLTPREEDPLRAATVKALAACIPVFEIDRRSTGESGKDYVTFIGSDFEEQGRRVARWFIQNVSGPINYVELYGSTGADPAIKRHLGFHEVIDKEKRFTFLAGQDGDFTLPKGKSVMQNFISKFGNKIDMVYSHNDAMAVGAFQAWQGAGVSKRLHVGTIDGWKTAVEYVADGKFDVCVQSNPRFGEITFKTIKDYIAGKAIPGWVVISDHIYTKENAKALVNTGF